MKEQVIQSLKLAMKAKGISYKVLAEKLEMSEASIKRIFSESTFSLDRFLKICELIGVPAENLFSLSSAQTKKYYEYSLKQEEFFAKNPQHLAFFDLLLKGEKPKQIGLQYKLTKKQIYRFLADLQKLGFIEWLPKDKVRLLIPNNVQWRTNGPLRKKLLPLAKQEFLSGSFQAEHSEDRFLLIDLSAKNIKKLQLKIKELVDDLAKDSDLDLLVKEKRSTMGLFLAYRPWNFSKLKL